ncbi:S41 family peptidase [Dyadobacter sp. CY261]|uniref:S41 family peptidase n=1 Tax=Dyadobacter sp. CY261 TaxID=2907203 RepID=UPI001F290253|nr:S41 family peptidase [Dyadobacter sp. CY261]MCF0072744.1 S41 family peptidase [Dyadobacter sp. CY261]
MKSIESSPYWVRGIIVYFLLFNLPVTCIFAQHNLPVIKATATNVKIKDGYVIREGIWNLSPEVKPDVYYVLRPNSKHNVTFYTDIDSIFFSVLPGNDYEFIVLLNGKDSCFTRISAVGAGSIRDVGQGTEALISPEMLAMDFVVFRDYLQSEHPGLYRYKSRERLQAVFDSCLLSITRPQTRLEFARKILFAISEIQDGHTGSNISSLLIKSYLESTKLFPLYLYFVNDKAFISCNNTDGLPVGTEILSIDNKPILEVRAQLFSYLPSDGSIETKKNQTLNNNGAFPFLYRWIFGFADSFSVNYKSTAGDIKTIQVPARLASDFECEINAGRKSEQMLSLEYPKRGVGLLTIKTFDRNRLGGADQYFEKFLVKSFLELNEKNVENLIIDLRDNAGGQDEYGAQLYSYLTSKPFRYYASVESTGKVYTKEENSLLGTLQPQAYNFRGKVFILINGLSFSTTAEFCAITKSNLKATFIGEETGGGYNGNTSGQTMKIELPNSHVQVIIPRFKYVNQVKASSFTDRGVIPDHKVIPDVLEYVNGMDVALQYTFDLIDGSKK